MSQFVRNGEAPAFRGAEPPPGVELETLRVIHAQFARQLQLAISATLHCDIAASVTGIRQGTYADFGRALPSPAYQGVIALPPEKGSAVLQLSPEVTFPMLELMMGASVTSPGDLKRALTTVEQDLLDALVKVVLRPLANAWKSVADVEFRLLPRNSRNPDLPLPHQTVTIVTFEMEIGKDAKGFLGLALPSALVRKAQVCSQPQMSAPERAPANDQADLILGLLQPAILEFEARLRGPKVGLRDLLNLKEGQIVLLENALDGVVDGLLNNTACYRGHVVSDGKHRVLLIDGFVESETA